MTMDYQAKRKEALEQIEGIVDALSMTEALELLYEVSCLKAEHLRINWQDEQSARLWDRAATGIDRARTAIIRVFA
jgi:hypothetical protein